MMMMAMMMMVMSDDAQYLHWRYFLLLLWPVNIGADYSFDCIPLVSDAGDARMFAAYALYAAAAGCAGGCAVKLLRARPGQPQRLLHCLLW
jgi:hypothetical protein